jgi:UTP--glucose-1-phosphate uridylyltransferase
MPKKEENAGGTRAPLVKAVIPAGGLGTRLEPLSFAVPKELLPVNRRPMIQLAVEEALSSGIRDIGIVIRRGKEAIRTYFESLMASSNPSCEALQRELSSARLRFVYQQRRLGLGNAIWEAGEFVSGSPFVMIIPDQFVLSSVPATRQLLGAARRDFQAVWNSLMSVSREEVELFPGARMFELAEGEKNTWKVRGFRKESERVDEEILLGFGRTLFPAGALEYFSDRYVNPASGEVDLLLSFEALFEKFPNYAVLLEGRAMDFGTWAGYERFFGSLGEPL